MRTAKEEKIFADLFAEKAGIKPLINQLLKTDLYSAKKIIVVGRKLLWERLVPKEQISLKGVVREKNLTTHDIVKGMNKDLVRFGNIQINPKNEKEFTIHLNTIANTILMFLFHQIPIKQGEKEQVIKEINETIESFSLVFDGIASKDSFENTRQLILQSLPEEKKSKHTKNITKEGEDVTGIVREEFHESESTKSKSNILPEEILLTKKEACELLRVSTTTIWRLEKKGEITKPIRKGGSVKYRKTDLLNYLNSN